MQSVAVKKRASWLSHDPVTGRSKSGLPLRKTRLTETDYNFLLTCHEHYGSSAYLAALYGVSEDWARKNIKTLKRHPHFYLEPSEEQAKYPTGFNTDYKFYVTAENGYTELAEAEYSLPLRAPRSSFKHDVMRDQGILSAKIGARHHPEIDLILPDEIAAELADKKTIWRFPTTVDSAHYRKPRTAIIPDYLLGIERTFDNDKPPFVAFEFETGANNIKTYEYDNSAIAYKLKGWVDVIEHDVPWTHLKIPTDRFFIAFVCATKTRKNSVLSMVNALVPKALWPRFIVKTHPLLGGREKPRASGHMLEEDFERLNGSFNMLTSKE